MVTHAALVEHACWQLARSKFATVACGPPPQVVCGVREPVRYAAQSL